MTRKTQNAQGRKSPKGTPVISDKLTGAERLIFAIYRNLGVYYQSLDARRKQAYQRWLESDDEDEQMQLFPLIFPVFS